MVAGGDTTVTGPSQEQAAGALTPSCIFQDDLGYEVCLRDCTKVISGGHKRESVLRFLGVVFADGNIVSLAELYFISPFPQSVVHSVTDSVNNCSGHRSKIEWLEYLVIISNVESDGDDENDCSTNPLSFKLYTI